MYSLNHRFPKRFLSLGLSLYVCLSLLGCGVADSSAVKPTDAAEQKDRGKLQIVATLFPQYDFARQIAGDLADITLLLPPGADSHAYEPSPSDIIKIQNADVFLYTGEEMEVWAKRLLDGLQPPGPLVVDVSKSLTLVTSESVEKNGDHTEAAHGDGGHVYEPHIWTSPVMAKQMVLNIRDGLSEADPANTAPYAANAAAYLESLDELDGKFREVVADGKRKNFIFGSRFASYYFAAEYGLDYDSAFDSCSGETEPSAKALARLITYIREAGIPVVYYQELTDQKVALSVAEATGAKPLLFHSCHNVTKEDLENGATYLSLMEQNVENLKAGLS